MCVLLIHSHALYFADSFSGRSLWLSADESVMTTAAGNSAVVLENPLLHPFDRLLSLNWSVSSYLVSLESKGGLAGHQSGPYFLDWDMNAFSSLHKSFEEVAGSRVDMSIGSVGKEQDMLCHSTSPGNSLKFWLP